MKRYATALVVLGVISLSGCATAPVIDPVNDGPVGALNRAKDILPATLSPLPNPELSQHDFSYASGSIDMSLGEMAPFNFKADNCSANDNGELFIISSVTGIPELEVSSYEITFDVTENGQYVGTAQAYAYSVPAGQTDSMQTFTKVSKPSASLTCVPTGYRISTP